MNRTLTFTAFAMFAAMMMIAPLGSSVFAEKKDKVDVCHFSEAEIEIDLETGEEVIVEEEQWAAININGNAVDKHLQNHVDTLIDDSDEPAEGTITTTDCLALNEPEPDPEPESEV